jgi:IS4 transposase
LYNQRQTIEAFFKASKHVFGMTNLRSRRFLAIAVFLRFVLLTNNLLVWTKAALFAGTQLVAAHTRCMVEYRGVGRQKLRHEHRGLIRCR